MSVRWSSNCGDAGMLFDAQREFPVFYHGELIGHLTPDLIVDDAIIVDPKVVSAFNEAHIAQMVGYLHDQWPRTGVVIELQIRQARLETNRTTADNSESDSPDLYA